MKIAFRCLGGAMWQGGVVHMNVFLPRAYVGARLCVRATEGAVHIYNGYARPLAIHERDIARYVT